MAAFLVLRSLLTEKPSEAVSFGTFSVEVPWTLTVRSAAAAVLGRSSTSITVAIAVRDRGFIESTLPGRRDAHSGLGAAAGAQARRADQLDRPQGGVGDHVELDPVALLDRQHRGLL